MPAPPRSQKDPIRVWAARLCLSWCLIVALTLLSSFSQEESEQSAPIQLTQATSQDYLQIRTLSEAVNASDSAQKTANHIRRSSQTSNLLSNELLFVNNGVIFLTGMVGFIGFHTTCFLLSSDFYDNVTIVGFDNFIGSNPYYPAELKYERLRVLKELYFNVTNENKKLILAHGDLFNLSSVESVLSGNGNDLILDGVERKDGIKFEHFTHVLHLAAQAGVRYSAENPFVYVESNVNGFVNLLETIARNDMSNVPIVYASSSSVYGMSQNVKSSSDLDLVQINSENNNHIMPESVYAATKKTDELLSWTYHKIYNMNLIGLRFFTVYGTFGRPDMAYMIFAKNMLQNESIYLYNNGNMKRDFTHVSDIVDGILRSLNYIVEESIRLKKSDNNEESKSVWNVFNLGNGHPRLVMDLVNILKNSFEHTNYDKIEKVNNKPNGDVFTTFANVTKAHNLLGYKPKISLEHGIQQFAKWFEQDQHDPKSNFVKHYLSM